MADVRHVIPLRPQHTQKKYRVATIFLFMRAGVHQVARGAFVYD
jgi:hypothetical protein